MNRLNSPLIGYDHFPMFIQLNGYFVDKTMFIRELFQKDPSKILIITRPRRFGKSVTMSMFASFLKLNYANPQDLSNHQKLFEDTKIIEDQKFCQEFMGQYPVIFISLKDLMGSDFNSAYDELAFLISNLYKSFNFLLDSNCLTQEERRYIHDLIDLNQLLRDPNKKIKINSSLLNLCEFLYKHFNKNVILLIDEYDVPMAKAVAQGYYDELIIEMRNLYSKALKSNTYLYKAVLTGCLPISKESIFTGLTNLAVNSVLSDSNRLSDLIGFTNNETYEMLKYYNLLEHFDLVNEWYDGYNFYNHDIYSPSFPL